MLIYFKVGNYKSIKEPVVINFSASSVSEHQATNTYSKGRHSLLRSVLLYGPNASGKSKIIDAFAFFRWYIIRSATDRQSNEETGTEPFRLNTLTKKEPSQFEAEFIVGGRTFRYGFEADVKEIQKEWLLEVKVTTTQALFLRIGQQIEVTEKKFPEGLGLDKRTRKNALFLSVAAQWNGELAQQITEWFSDIYTVHGLFDGTYKGLTSSLLKSPEYEKSINEFIRKADFGINELHILEVTNEAKDDILNNTPKELRETVIKKIERDKNPVFATHNLFDENGKIVGQEPLSLLQDESDGTQKFFNLAGIFLEAVKNGRLVVIDELDGRLHTLLTKAIIHMFNSGDLKNEAQLLAVSHDVALLDKDLLRRDQLYFVEKDNFGATKVTALVEYKARKEAPYYKNYLEGKYGAIPFIEDLETVLSDGEKS